MDSVKKLLIWVELKSILNSIVVDALILIFA